MAKNTCSIEGCDNYCVGRGWCKTHYYRWWRNGHPMALRPGLPPPIVRFWRCVQVDPDGCWTWTALLTELGYGRFSVNKRNHPAHRWLYEYLRGPLPRSLDVDHLCHNADPDCRGGSTCLHRRCVNPAHLEAVSRRENTLRGKAIPAINARKTHCPRGHAYDVIEPNRRGCSVCIKAHNVAGAIRRRERRERRNAAQGPLHDPV